MRRLILIAHNVRSTHNVGSLLRTADGLGVEKVFLTGYTPYPKARNDTRLPHLAEKLHRQISKTALGAESSVTWEHIDSIEKVLHELRAQKYEISALEQAPHALKLPDYKPANKTAIIIGREVEGIEPDVLALADKIIEIPMFGQKESFNVAAAAAITLYHCRFSN